VSEVEVKALGRIASSNVFVMRVAVESRIIAHNEAKAVGLCPF